jgi:hypothetical protein
MKLHWYVYLIVIQYISVTELTSKWCIQLYVVAKFIAYLDTKI